MRYTYLMERSCIFRAQDGVKLGYRVLTAGNQSLALVMIHGLASNLTRWTEFSESVNLEGWMLLRLDLRGHGSSMCRGRISHRQWVDDLNYVLEHEGCSRAVILGHSLGAQVGLHFAATYPEKTAGLILVDPVIPDCLEGKLALAGKLRPLLWLLIRLLWLGNFLGFRRRHFPPLDLYTLDRETRELLKSDAGADIASIYAQPLSDIRHLPLANYLQDVYEVTRALPCLAGIQVPTLTLLSRGTGIASLERNKQYIEDLPDNETVVIDADHWMLTEKPDEARVAIERWCRQMFDKPGAIG